MEQTFLNTQVPDTPGLDPRLKQRRLRLDTLVRLRWVAVLGQSITILVVSEFFQFDLPLLACFSVIALAAALNIIIRAVYPASTRLSTRWAAALLAFDIFQTSALLFFTGGLENPFFMLLLVPTMISAMSLPLKYTLALGTTMVLSAVFLAYYHFPLPWGPNQISLPPIYVLGLLVALVCCLLFMGIYAFRIAHETRQLADALAAAELVLAREHHLSALDGLAAAAAHELGTPLGTIALIAKELTQEAHKHPDLKDDIELLRTQSERCRDILSHLTSLSTEGGADFIRMPYCQLMEEVSAPHQNFGIDISIQGIGAEPQPLIARNPAVHYGLGNLVENAVDYAASRVDIRAQWTPDKLICIIEDDGPGFLPEVLARMGDPYVTSSKHSGASRKTGQREHNIGLGLGFFIAKTLLERSGASLSVTNFAPPRSGAIVTLSWPRAALEIKPTPPGIEFSSEHTDIINKNTLSPAENLPSENPAI